MNLIDFITSTADVDLGLGGPLEPVFEFVIAIFPLTWCLLVLTALLLFGYMLLSPLVIRLIHRHDPRLTVPAKITDQRTESFSINRNPVFTVWYTTFQVDSGDCMELRVSEQWYHALSAGMQGRVTFKGRELVRFKETSHTLCLDNKKCR